MTLADDIAGPESDLLGVSRWLSIGLPGQGRSSVARATVAKFQSPASLRGMLERRRADGYLGVVGFSDPRLFEAVGRRPNPAVPRPIPILPNLSGFMREAVEYGMVGAGLRRAWRVGPLALAGLGVRGMGRAPALLKRDFPTMLRCFVELELADFSRYDPPVVFLQAQMTDLALAMHNPRILEAFIEAVHARTGSEPGVMTQNFGALTAALKTWGVEVAAVITPWTLDGGAMRPSAEACRLAAKASPIPIWSDRQGRLDPPDRTERAHWTGSGLAGALRDDLSVWCET